VSQHKLGIALKRIVSSFR